MGKAATTQDQILPKDAFFKKMEEEFWGLSYDDVLLRTGYSEILPSQVNLLTRFSRNVWLKNPLVSAAMDKVTHHAMAIAMAINGGLGIIDKSLTPDEQSHEVNRVKYYMQGGVIERPICARPEETVESLMARKIEKGYDFTSFPVVNDRGELLGLITGTDIKLCHDYHQTVSENMSTKLITAPAGTPISEAYRIMKQPNVKKKVLPLIDNHGKLAGMYVARDVVDKITGRSSEKYSLDKQGRLMVGAAVGVGEEAMHRVELLAKKGVDVIVIDTAHGNSKLVIDTLRSAKRKFPELDIVAGNVTEAAGAVALAKAGADGIKVGQGAGSICTTRIVAGVGCPQLTAVYQCAKALRESAIPVCADGGVKYSGDIPKALAAGAETVMIGSLFAGTEESPGEKIIEGKMVYKEYRGMGSLSAMRDSVAAKERYGQTKVRQDKLVPEGMEAKVPYKGEVKEIILQLIGGLCSGMGYLGSKTIKELQERARFYRITDNGVRESHPHDVIITKEAPNYNGR